MTENFQERIWTFTADEGDSISCPACDIEVKEGDKVVSCPRCKEVHHFACWTQKGACSTLGCSQLADPALATVKPSEGDPPTKESFSWLPWALIILLVTLIAGGAIYNVVSRKDQKDTVSVMIPADFDFDIIHKVGEQFAQKHDPYKVNVLSIPTENPVYYEQKLVIMLVARDAPDIIFLPYDRFLFYAEEGALAELDSIKQAATAIVPYGNRLDNGMVDGTLYGIPHPTKAGFYSIITISENLELSKQLLLEIVAAMPYTPDIDDMNAAPPPTVLDALRGTASKTTEDDDTDQ